MTEPENNSINDLVHLKSVKKLVIEEVSNKVSAEKLSVSDLPVYRTRVTQWLHDCTNKSLYGKWYAAVVISTPTTTEHKYIRYDGKLFHSMQRYPLDIDGGTYFSLEREARLALEKYVTGIKGVINALKEVTAECNQNPTE